MNDFRREMRRRGVYADAYPDRCKGSASTQKRRLQPARGAKPAAATTTKIHGRTVVQIVPCGVHPLHSVKVHASGSRGGCPMCEMQIEDLCRSTVAHAPTPRPHAPRISIDRTRIIGCSCGWRTPPGTTDSDDAYVLHATVPR